MDEIGRGTSTYDGLSIAWAVIEHLHGREGPKTLFATHYHELTRLSQTLPRLQNFSVAVKEWNDEIIFMRQVTHGASERSFGIQVARLAGLPDEVVGRAKEILAGLEKGDGEKSGQKKLEAREAEKVVSSEAETKVELEEEKKARRAPKRRSKDQSDPSQLELF